MKVKNIRIHNRPAYNSEVHSTRDMGVGELNNCYEDAELADTIFAVGANALETQTNYFLNHWVPNLRGTRSTRRRRSWPTSRIGGPDRHRRSAADGDGERLRSRRRQGPRPASAINSGTDLALFNALLTYIADKGWTDKAFIAASTKDFDKALAANKTCLDDAARITGLEADQFARRPNGSPSRSRAARGGARCSPTRRA